MSKSKNQPTTNNNPRQVTSAVSSSFWQTHKWAAAVFGVLGFVLYAYSLNCEYVLDDQIVYTDNKFTQKGFGGIGSILSKETFVGYFGEKKELVEGSRYRPLSLITFAIEHSLAAKPVFETKIIKNVEQQVRKKNKHGEDLSLAPAALGHFNNIVLFILSTLLLYRVLFMLFTKEDVEEQDKPWYFSLPFIASLLFLLHPIHTEAVANIKGRDEIMAFIGSFAALYFVIKYVKNQSSKNLMWAGASFFLGLLSKENALTFLFVIPVTLYYFTKATPQQIKVSLGVLFGVFLFWLLIRTSVIGLSKSKEITDIMNNPFYGMSLSDRFATVFYTLGLYIKLLFVPIELTHDYYPYQIPIMNWGRWESSLSLIVHLALAGYAIWGFRQKTVASYCILFYIATLSIVSNLVISVGTFMNERFVYLSSVGFCILLAYWATQSLPRFVKTNIQGVNLVGGLLIAIIGAGYGFKTITRVPDWKTKRTLNEAAIKVSPNSARANLFMGTALFEDAQKLTATDTLKRDMMKRAHVYVGRALEILPTYGSAWQMKSGLDAELFAFDKDIEKLLQNFESSLLHRELLTVERPSDKAVYVDLYMEYLAGRVDLWNNILAFYKRVIPVFLEQKKDGTNALRYTKYALQIAPQDADLNTWIAKAQALEASQKKIVK